MFESPWGPQREVAQDWCVSNATFAEACKLVVPAVSAEKQGIDIMEEEGKTTCDLPWPQIQWDPMRPVT